MIQFRPGDEIVILHRRHSLTEDENKQQIETHTDTTISIVNCPEEFKCQSGTLTPEWSGGEKESQDKRYLVIRLEMR